jgi:Ni/Co efflux regulator RcnB
LGDPSVRSAWGISDEQNQQMTNHLIAAIEVINEDIHPFVIKVQTGEKDGNSTTEISMHSTDLNVTMAEVKAFIEKTTVLMAGAAINALRDGLTPEQWQKLDESQLANMGEMPIISPSAFAALDLTAEQRQEMEKIKKELAPEFEKTLDKWADGHFALQIMSDTKDTERKKIIEEMQTQGRAFSTKFRTRMFDVLTDEQWQRLQKLIDNPPEHALVFRKKLRKLLGSSEEGENGKETEKANVWVPGPNSWKPGDPIPDAYRQERSTRGNFPRPKSKSEE